MIYMYIVSDGKVELEATRPEVDEVKAMKWVAEYNKNSAHFNSSGFIRIASLERLMMIKSFDEIERAMSALKDEFNKRRGALLVQRNAAIMEACPEFIVGQHQIDEYWQWGCKKSPIGLCVYDTGEDPCRDECIYCGDPEERK